MATITLRVDDRTRDDIEAVARGRGVTVSDLLRSSIFEILGRDVPGNASSTPQTLTVVERRHLALQHEILAVLHADDKYDAAHHLEAVEILTNGYTGEYETVFAGIYTELARRDCVLVWDLLDMFRVLRASLARLKANDRAALGEDAERVLIFRGFDFNEEVEGRLADYARHLVTHGRWEELAVHFDDEHEHGNSHAPLLAAYMRMLDAFKPIWDGKINDQSRGLEDRYALTPTELRAVADAWDRPGR